MGGVGVRLFEMSRAFPDNCLYHLLDPEASVLNQDTLPKHPTVCKTMAFRAIILGLGPLFYIFWWFR